MTNFDVNRYEYLIHKLPHLSEAEMNEYKRLYMLEEYMSGLGGDDEEGVFYGDD